MGQLGGEVRQNTEGLAGYTSEPGGEQNSDLVPYDQNWQKNASARYNNEQRCTISIAKRWALEHCTRILII